MAFELAQVIAQLVQAIGFVGDVECGEDGLVDLFGGPAADMTAAVQEHLEEADDARVVDLDAGIADRADGDRRGEAAGENRSRVAGGWSNPFLSRESARLLVQLSLSTASAGGAHPIACAQCHLRRSTICGAVPLTI